MECRYDKIISAFHAKAEALFFFIFFLHTLSRRVLIGTTLYRTFRLVNKPHAVRWPAKFTTNRQLRNDLFSKLLYIVHDSSPFLLFMYCCMISMYTDMTPVSTASKLYTKASR